VQEQTRFAVYKRPFFLTSTRVRNCDTTAKRHQERTAPNAEMSPPQPPNFGELAKQFADVSEHFHRLSETPDAHVGKQLLSALDNVNTHLGNIDKGVGRLHTGPDAGVDARMRSAHNDIVGLKLDVTNINDSILAIEQKLDEYRAKKTAK
jgi:hypothetical protein